MKEIPRQEITKLKNVYMYAQKYMEQNTNHPYHNFRHAKDVTHAVSKLADYENVSKQDRFLLLTAALMHDAVYEKGYNKNEELTVTLAETILPVFNYTPQEIESVKSLILATKTPTNPQNKLEMIICDADLDSLGKESFFEKGNYLRRELYFPQGKRWYERQLSFLNSHSYYTNAAKALREKGLNENKKKLQELIETAA